jgi:serine/threonine protein kinase
MISSGGVAKITSFEHAIEITGSGQYRAALPTSVVNSDAIHYIAPELFASVSRADATYSAKADVWSIAMIAVYLHDGVPPTTGAVQNAKQQLLRWHDAETINVGLERAHTALLQSFLSSCTRAQAARPSAAELLAHRFLRESPPPAAVAAFLSQ